MKWEASRSNFIFCISNISNQHHSISNINSIYYLGSTINYKRIGYIDYQTFHNIISSCRICICRCRCSYKTQQPPAELPSIRTMKQTQRRRLGFSFLLVVHILFHAGSTVAFSPGYLYKHRMQQQRKSLNSLQVVSFTDSFASVNLVAASLVLWDETVIYRTQCGPLFLDDRIEIISYMAVIVTMSTIILGRTILGTNLVGTLESIQQREVPIGPPSRNLLQLSEIFTFAAVAGAIIVLFHQYRGGGNMDGLSGIDVSFCRAIRDFR